MSKRLKSIVASAVLASMITSVTPGLSPSAYAIDVNAINASSTAKGVDAKTKALYASIENLIQKANKEKNVYNFVEVYKAILKVTDSTVRNKYLDQLSDLSGSILTPNVIDYINKLDGVVKNTKSKEYKSVVSALNKDTKVKSADKTYLLSQLTKWDKDIVDSACYATGVTELMNCRKGLAAKNSSEVLINKIEKAKEVIAKVTNKNVKDYLLSEIAKVEKAGIITVNSVDNFKDMSVDYGTQFSKLDLPSKARLVLSNNSSKTVDVTWSAFGYNSTKPGSYTLKGIYKNPSGVVGSLKEVVVKVTVKDKVTPVDTITVKSVGTLSDISADYGTEFSKLVLPSKVKLTLSNNTSKEVDVTWSSDSYKANEAGSYTIKGSYKNPTGVVGSLKDVVVKVVVKAKVDPNMSLNDITSCKSSYVISSIKSDNDIYGPSQGIKSITGNVSISVPNADANEVLTLRNLAISGDINVEFGAGTIILDNVTVNGVKVTNVGSHSLHVKGNSTITNLSVQDTNNDAHIVVEGNASIITC